MPSVSAQEPTSRKSSTKGSLRVRLPHTCDLTNDKSGTTIRDSFGCLEGAEKVISLNEENQNQTPDNTYNGSL